MVSCWSFYFNPKRRFSHCRHAVSFSIAETVRCFEMFPIKLDGRLIAFDTIMHEPLPPVDWLVESLIPNGSRSVVFGEFGCMKSWLLLDLGLHIAAGKHWLDQFAIPKPKSVLYI